MISSFYCYKGTNCTEYIQEGAAIGPSSGAANLVGGGVAFNPAICGIQAPTEFVCPADPLVRPIYTEEPPITTAVPTVRSEAA